MLDDLTRDAVDFYLRVFQETRKGFDDVIPRAIRVLLAMNLSMHDDFVGVTDHLELPNVGDFAQGIL